jgi:xylulokinase
MAGALGLGLTRTDVAVSIGTSGTVYSVSDVPTSDPTGAVAGFADATGRFLPLVCTLNAAGVTDAVARLLEVDPAGLDALALAAPAGAGGLVLVPYLAGERTPDRPDATGSLLGIRPDVSRSALARSAVEGVVCGLLEGLAALGAQGVTVDEGRVMLIGGGARSEAYRRVLADLAGRTVTVPEERELVAAGAAVQAAATVAGVDPARLAPAWGLGAGSTVEPDQAVDGAAVLEAFVAARG